MRDVLFMSETSVLFLFQGKLLFRLKRERPFSFLQGLGKLGLLVFPKHKCCKSGQISHLLRFVELICVTAYILSTVKQAKISPSASAEN